MNTKMKVALLVGTAWPFLGLGFMAIHFGYLPSGLDLIARCLGLFLAGASSAGLFIVIHGRLRTRFGRLMIYSGYLLFAPIGLMTALLVPGPVEFATTVSLLGLLLMAPMTTVILGNVAVAIGLAITGGLAVISNALAQRVGANNDMSFEPIRLRR